MQKEIDDLMKNRPVGQAALEEWRDKRIKLNYLNVVLPGGDILYVTAVEDLNIECRLLETDPAEPPEPLAPWDPIPPELAWNTCSSPWRVPLFEEGLLTFEVRSIDRAGNSRARRASHICARGWSRRPSRASPSNVTPSSKTWSRRSTRPSV